MRIVQKFLRGRCILRPYFDFVETKCIERKYSKVIESFTNRNIKQTTSTLRNINNTFLVLNTIIPSLTYSTSKGMALNKLSIDKVDLTDKRVLIR